MENINPFSKGVIMINNKSIDTNDSSLQAVIDLVENAVQNKKESIVQRIGREITISELGLMLRNLPPNISNTILRNCADHARIDIQEIANGKTNPEMDKCSVCFKSKYADYCANTPEKAIQKYLDIYKGLISEGMI
jgi:hypothetical protein